jgi:hypothetical protein
MSGPVSIAAPGDALGRDTSPRSTGALRSRWRWVLLTCVVVLVAVGWILWTDTRPTYDAFGWLVWGRQVLEWNLNTDGAPSWKPLTFLFSLPYALAGLSPQMWLWMLTSTVAALAGAVFAGRLAYRLTGPQAAAPWAPWVAAAAAGIGILGLSGYAELVLIANSDPMVMTLCLAAVDCHLSGRRRLAFALLVGVGLGRPEGWAFIALYAAWLWRTDPGSRVPVLAGSLAVPLAWFGVPALTSHSWFTSGNLAFGSPNVIHGNKVIGVLERLRNLFPVSYQLTVVGALVFAIVRRERIWLSLAGAAAFWTAIEIAFAYHGWSAVPRYLLEPASLLVVLAGAGVGRLIAYRPRSESLWRLAPIAVVLVLGLGLIPTIRSRARLTHGQIDDSNRAATVLSNLRRAIGRDGTAALKACGVPVAPLQYQTELAWALGVNVASVGWRPQMMIASRQPIVLFTSVGLHWSIRPVHTPTAMAATCDRLRIGT